MNSFSNGVWVPRFQRVGLHGAAAFAIALIMLGALLGRPGEGQAASPSGDVADFLLAVGGALAGATGSGEGARALAAAAIGAFIMSGPGCFGKASPTTMWCGPLVVRKPLLSAAFNTYLSNRKTWPTSGPDANWYGPDAGGFYFSVRWIGTYDPNGTYPLDCAAGPPGGPRYYAIFSSSSAINACGPYGGGYYGSQAGMDYLWRQFRGVCGANPSAAAQVDADAWTRCDNWSNVKPPLDSTIRAQPTWQALMTMGVERIRQIVAIDPGHGQYGGSCPPPSALPQMWDGATGPAGGHEDDLVLDIANRITANLTNRGYQVRQTRTGLCGLALSLGVDLRMRVAQAEQRPKAAIFVSVHLNSVANAPTTNGTEVWIDPDRPQASRSRSLAIGIANAQSTSLNLQLRPWIRYSPPRPGASATDGIRHSGYDSPWTPPPQGNGRIGVLRDTSMPAALSEVAFLSNPQQEQSLINGASGPGYRQNVADVIALAIAQFLGLP